MLLFMRLFLNILSGMANSVDPVRLDCSFMSSLIWVSTAYVILSETLVFEILGHLPYAIIALNIETP